MAETGFLNAVRGCLSVLLATTILLVADGAAAQDDRQSVFNAMFDRPDDRDLMLRYARLVASEGDFEAAAATLERLLDLEPANQAARLELAKAYFALGQNAVAQYHLDLYLQRADLTPAEAAAAAALSREAANRESGFQYAGLLEAGGVYSTDTGDIGLSYSARLRMSWDLGGRRPNSWDMLIRLDGRAYDSVTTPDGRQAFLRTGPTLSLTDRAFGPRLQPYLEVGSVEDADIVQDGDRALLGLYYTNPVSGTLAVYADIAYGVLNRGALAGDANVSRYMLGADLQASQQTMFRLSLRREDERADPGGIDRDRNTARLDAFHYFSPGLNRSGRDWLAEGFVQYDREVTTGPNEDKFLTYGVALKAFVREDTYVRAAVRRIDRNSTVPGLSRQTTLFSLTAGWEF